MASGVADKEAGRLMSTAIYLSGMTIADVLGYRWDDPEEIAFYGWMFFMFVFYDIGTLKARFKR